MVRVVYNKWRNPQVLSSTYRSFTTFSDLFRPKTYSRIVRCDCEARGKKMTKKKRTAPEPPIFTGNERLEIEAAFRPPCCRPKPSTKTRHAPPPPLPRKTIPSKSTSGSTNANENNVSPNAACDNRKVDNRNVVCTNFDDDGDAIVAAHAVPVDNSNNNKKKTAAHRKARQIIRRDYFSDEDDFDDLSFESATPPPTSKTPTMSTRPASSSGTKTVKLFRPTQGFGAFCPLLSSPVWPDWAIFESNRLFG